MSRIRVFLATTEGPAEIQRLREEIPEIRSVVCLNGTAEALPISNAYDAFVRRPTGVVERMVGHPAFRLDVSHPVTHGHSWQLGVLLAHALAAQDRLAQKNDSADLVVWASGTINHDLDIGTVEHLAEKLEKSRPLFERLATEGTRIVLCVPHGNWDELAALPLSVAGFKPGEGSIKPAAHFDDLIKLLDLGEVIPKPVPKPEKAPAPVPKKRPPTKPFWRRQIPALAALFVLAMLAGLVTAQMLKGPKPALTELPPIEDMKLPAPPVAPSPVIVGKRAEAPVVETKPVPSVKAPPAESPPRPQIALAPPPTLSPQGPLMPPPPPFSDCSSCPRMAYLPPAALGGGGNVAVSQTLVTVRQWGKCVLAGACPSLPGRPRPNDPATGMTGAQARAYASWLGAQTGQPYRLPSSGEWAIASRIAAFAKAPLSEWTNDCVAGAAGDCAYQIVLNAAQPGRKDSVAADFTHPSLTFRVARDAQ